MRRHGAVRAVAAEHNNGDDARPDHGFRRPVRIVHCAADPHRQVMHLGELLLAQIARPREPAIDVAPDAAVLWHHDHVADAARAQAGEHTQNDVSAIGNLQARRVGDDAADVAGRYGVRDDANERRGALRDASESVDVDRRSASHPDAPELR
jgi:hypothetical protein